MYLLLNLVAMVVFLGVIATMIFSLAGRWDVWNVWAYAGIVTVVFLFMTLGTYRISPDLLKERIRPPTRGRVRWPSSLVTVVVSILQSVIVGLDQRFHWSDIVAPAGVVAGLGLVAIGVGLMTWSALVNPFFSPVTRIQADRGQQVISAGPYRIVRHPGYAGALLWLLASPLALNSLLAMIPVVVIMVPLTLYQTMIEDRMLRGELAGYADYAVSVHYRLIPGVW
jgi:protein-S-isoprenylcysteine O-methyltransferase Ste14